MPLVVAEMQFPICLVSVLVALEKSFRLRFLTCLYPLRHDVGQPALTQQLQDVLTVKLPVHQHVIDMNSRLCRIQEVLDDLLARVPFA